MSDSSRRVYTDEIRDMLSVGINDPAVILALNRKEADIGN